MTNKGLIAGIDVGFSGAICVIGMPGEMIVKLVDIPTIKVGRKTYLDGQRIKNILFPCSHIFIEKAQTMPKQGVVSMGGYMEGFGMLQGICIGLGVPYTLVRPQTWKKAMMPDMPKEKGSSIVRVKQLYPDLELPRKKDHGKSDAVLIALWGVKDG